MKELYDIWLSLMAGSGKNTVSSLYSAFGSAAGAFECDDILSVCPSLPKKAAEALEDKSLEKAEEILDKCQTARVGILAFDDPLYPKRLKAIADPPAVLYYKGKPADLDSECLIAIVGTRKASSYGKEITRGFARSLAESGAVIVSGLASGADAAAHEGALSGGGMCVAVLGTPIDRVYPAENARLYEDVGKNGVIFSEYYPGCVTNAACFPARNRIIAGLSCGVLVTEAGEHSGALITANAGVRQGKPVWAIPGRAGSDGSEGTNGMLKTGALMAERPSDILEQFELIFPDRIRLTRKPFKAASAENTCSPRKTEAPKPMKPLVSATLDCLNTAERRVLSAFDGTARSADEIAASLAEDVTDIMSTLTILEIYGLIKPVAGGKYILN